MAVEVTLTVPDPIYREVEQIAAATQRDVSQVMLDAVKGVVSPFYVDEDGEQMAQEVAAFEAMHSVLWIQYPQQYLAIYQGKVIDHDENKAALLERIEATHPNEVVLIRQVLAEPQGVLRYHSPRTDWAFQAVPTLAMHPQREAMLREEAAFEQKRVALWQQYANQFVAMHQAEVVDHDADEETLIARIEAAYPDKVVLIRQVLEKPEPPLVFRSPRLLHENDC
jgi:hypothetical protein